MPGRWREYIDGRSQEERLDYLMGQALMDETISQQLLTDPEPLLVEFEFSESTREWFRSFKATNLTELAQALAASPRRPRGD